MSGDWIGFITSFQKRPKLILLANSLLIPWTPLTKEQNDTSRQDLRVPERSNSTSRATQYHIYSLQKYRQGSSCLSRPNLTPLMKKHGRLLCSHPSHTGGDRSLHPNHNSGRPSVLHKTVCQSLFHTLISSRNSYGDQVTLRSRYILEACSSWKKNPPLLYSPLEASL